jgi:hypothetical protein
LIIDDNQAPQTVDKHPVIGGLLRTASMKMTVAVVRGPGRGPHHNHEYARTSEHAKELVWRLDDDECPNSDVLAGLERELISNADTGAVAGSVFIPGMCTTLNPHASSQIEDILSCHNVQNWKAEPGTRYDNVGHLHSTYLYRKDAAMYDLDMSSVGHTEETRHTIQMKLNGWRLVVLNDLVTWHYRQGSGGIRSQQGDYAADERGFRMWLKSLRFNYVKRLPVLVTQGLGDGMALLSVMPDIIKAADPLFDAVQVFVKPEMLELYQTRITHNKVRLHPMSECELWYFSGEFGVYAWAVDAAKKRGWKGNLADAYRAMYMERIFKGAIL